MSHEVVMGPAGLKSKARAISVFDGITRRNVPNEITADLAVSAFAHLRPESGATQAMNRGNTPENRGSTADARGARLALDP